MAWHHKRLRHCKSSPRLRRSLRHLRLIPPSLPQHQPPLRYVPRRPLRCQPLLRRRLLRRLQNQALLRRCSPLHRRRKPPLRPQTPRRLRRQALFHRSPLIRPQTQLLLRRRLTRRLRRRKLPLRRFNPPARQQPHRATATNALFTGEFHSLLTQVREYLPKSSRFCCSPRFQFGGSPERRTRCLATP